MRTSILGLTAMALMGCAHQPAAPLSGVTVEIDSRGCLVQASPNVLLHVRNNSDRRIAFHSYTTSGPPYKLYPGSAQLLNVPAATPWHVVLEHFFPATQQVALDPGDQADFVYEPSIWPSAQEPGLFKLQLRDVQGGLHYSSGQGVCHPGSGPNNSFKPNPHRGIAWVLFRYASTQSPPRCGSA